MIIDGPPVTAGGDCWMLSRQVGHTLLVVEWNVTPLGAVGLALRQVASSPESASGDDQGGRACSAFVAGVILNKVKMSKDRKRTGAQSLMFG